MITNEKVELLIEQVAELPAEARSELFESLARMIAPNIEAYDRDDE